MQKDELIEQHIAEKMLEASEIFHYANKFKDALFLLVIDKDESLQEIIMDLRVVLAARVPCAIIYSASINVRDFVERWNTQGFCFTQCDLEASGDVSRSQLGEIIAKREIPLLKSQKENTEFYQLCVGTASELGANKLVFFTAERGLLVNQEYLSYPSIQDMQKFLSEGASFNVERELLTQLMQSQVVYGFDTVFLQAKSGSLFQELFTYRGSGTLITDSYPNVLRQAIPCDIADILFLLRPAMDRTLIRPLTEEQLIDSIDQFYVFTVDDKIVACARLTDYGSYSELGKICTLPRYQGKGRAKQLSLKLLAQAQELGKDGVFALSIEPLMWNFFQELGFSECARTELPEAWQKQYDPSRNSKAFTYRFSSDN